LRLHLVSDSARSPGLSKAASARVATSQRGEELIVSVPTNQGEWWVLFRQPLAPAVSPAHATQRTAWRGAVLGAARVVGALYWLGRKLSTLVTEPVVAAGAIASRVAGG